jgi:hypothetical protein
VEKFKKGDKVVYVGSSDEQVRWGGNDDPRELLIQGNVYQIEKVEDHSWHTKLHLRGIYGRFNSISFEKLYDGKNLH